MHSPSDTKLQALPAWITPELITETLRVWQPYYGHTLTQDDAIGMLLNVGNLFRCLSGSSSHEALCRPGTGQQSGTGT